MTCALCIEKVCVKCCYGNFVISHKPIIKVKVVTYDIKMGMLLWSSVEVLLVISAKVDLITCNS